MNDKDTDNEPFVMDRAMLTDELFWELLAGWRGGPVPFLLR